MIAIPQDFKDFLRLLNRHGVDYLLIGGYAVAFHGYVRNTGDMDIFVRFSPANVGKLKQVLLEFGFREAALPPEIFQEKGKIIRMGFPPMRLEIHTSITGVEFEECYNRRVVEIIEDTPINIIHVEDLKTNKAAAGRTKYLNDLEHLL